MTSFPATLTVSPLLGRPLPPRKVRGQPAPTWPAGPCAFRGLLPLVGDDGRSETAACASCPPPLSRQVVYPCRHPARADTPSCTAAVCRACPHHRPRAPGAAYPVAGKTRALAVGEYAARPGDPAVGVVVGSYGAWPRLVELQIRLIRRTCGPVPVLIADDASPRGQGELAALERAYEGVTFWPNDERLGHMGGDISAAWKGLQWARRLELQVLFKASQRLLVLGGRWAQDAALEMLTEGHAFAARECSDMGQELFVRSELMGFDVGAWTDGADAAYREFSPRRTGGVAELHYWGTVTRRFPQRVWRWPLLGVDRYRLSPGTLWHCADHPSAYRLLAAQLGLTLDEGFATAGWKAIEGDDWLEG